MVQSIFQEIAVVFVPQGYFSTQDDLELRANQAASRLTAKLQPLKDKVEKLERCGLILCSIDTCAIACSS